MFGRAIKLLTNCHSMDLPEYTTHINRKAEERKQLMVQPECFIGKF